MTTHQTSSNPTIAMVSDEELKAFNSMSKKQAKKHAKNKTTKLFDNFDKSAGTPDKPVRAEDSYISYDPTTGVSTAHIKVSNKTINAYLSGLYERGVDIRFVVDNILTDAKHKEFIQILNTQPETSNDVFSIKGKMSLSTITRFKMALKINFSLAVMELIQGAVCRTPESNDQHSILEISNERVFKYILSSFVISSCALVKNKDIADLPDLIFSQESHNSVYTFSYTIDGNKRQCVLKLI